MVRLFPMPEVAANTPEALLASWSAEENSSLSAGQPLAVVETDKAAVEIEADADATLVKILVPEGRTVSVGTPIALLAEPGETITDAESVLAQLDAEAHARRTDDEEASAAAAPAGVGAPPAPDTPRAPATPSNDAQPVNGHAPSPRIFVSPLARRNATVAGLRLADLTGSGPGGRIVRRDVEMAIARRTSAPAADTLDDAPTPSGHAPARTSADRDGGSRLIPLSRMRRAIAARLTASQQTVPHFYVRANCRIGRLLTLREELNSNAPIRVSVNDLVIKAAAWAQLRVPELNVVWTEDGLRRFDAVDVAIAVATETGLVTPVLQSVERLTISALAERTRDLGQRAKAGTLRPAEMEGGALTVSNLGMFGVKEFAAIINPPHAAILAVGAAEEEAVVVDGQIEAASVMHLTLSVDHRPVDGIVAARWMQALVCMLENPLQILT